MVNRSKQKGTLAESAICAYLIKRGWIHAERRTLSGAFDKGDIAGVPGVVIESKNAKAIDLAGWLTEAETEKANANAKVGAAWIKRRGTTDPGRWYVVMSGEQFTELLIEAGYQ